MLPSMFYLALAKFATNKLADVNPDEVARVLRLMRRATLGTSWMPALVGLGTGFVTGAAVGVLLARRPGSELRAELIDRMKSQFGWAATPSEPSERSETAPETTAPSNGSAAEI